MKKLYKTVKFQLLNSEDRNVLRLFAIKKHHGIRQKDLKTFPKRMSY